MKETGLIDNIKNIYRRISHAAMRVERNPEDVKLIAVTKNVNINIIKEAIDWGLRIFGESRVQEAKEKIEELSRFVHDVLNYTQISWHLIGHLQKNKAKTAVQLFDLIHSIDSLELARELNRHAEKNGKVQRVLIQVKLSEEETKYGIQKEGLMNLIMAVSEMKNLRIEGLMTIPPFFDNPEMARPYFIELRELRDKINSLSIMHYALQELSMGMTHDFEVAIEEGATMVRIGTGIFGER
ncbi:MAG: YggS family pyridoxal phosphate-dependent enzyme [Nitrospirae bacterium]|nr:YggS family pyridoxal phosphate-dependent enzyme [Nitrospirota bacterium]